MLRQISTLSTIASVHTIGYGPRPSLAKQHLQLPQTRSFFAKLVCFFLLIFRQHSSFYAYWFHVRRINLLLSTLSFDACLLNDVSAWPLIRVLPPSICILDAHEFSPEELSDNLLWSLLFKPFKTWCSSFSASSSYRYTVEPNLCALWESYTHLPFRLLRNTSYYVSSPRPSSAIQQTSTSIRVLHHGVAHPSRRIESMIEAVGLAGPVFTGHFLLAGGSTRYLRKLAKLAAKSSTEILAPIPQESLITYGSSFDVAILSIYPSNLNYQYCLPNKLFQFIQSRLPIVCGPTPAIANIIQQYDIGVVASDFSPKALSAALRELSQESITRMKTNLDKAAYELSWDSDQHLLLDDTLQIFSLPSQLNSAS